MNIIAKSREMKKSEIFKMTKNPAIQKMSDNVGLKIEVDSWLVYSDLNSKNEEQTILSIADNEGNIYATNSATFRQQFFDIVDMLEGEMVDVIEVVSGVSKNGRDYITCSYCGDK